MARNKRDNQRSKVYAWERMALRELGNRSILDWRPTIILSGASLECPLRRSNDRPGGREAHSHTRITLPRWAHSRWVILHELAHRLAPRVRAAAIDIV